MNYYKADITCSDGVHEHTYSGVVKAESLEAALKYMQDTHAYEYGEVKDSAWTSFGDGETAALVSVSPASATLDPDVVKDALTCGLVREF